MVWVGRDCEDHRVPPPAMGKATFHWTRSVGLSCGNFQGYDYTILLLFPCLLLVFLRIMVGVSRYSIISFY